MTLTDFVINERLLSGALLLVGLLIYIGVFALVARLGKD